MDINYTVLKLRLKLKQKYIYKLLEPYAISKIQTFKIPETRNLKL